MSLARAETLTLTGVMTSTSEMPTAGANRESVVVLPSTAYLVTAANMLEASSSRVYDGTEMREGIERRSNTSFESQAGKEVERNRGWKPEKGDRQRERRISFDAPQQRTMDIDHGSRGKTYANTNNASREDTYENVDYGCRDGIHMKRTLLRLSSDLESVFINN